MYVPEKEVLVWKIKSFPGGKEFMLRCKFALPSVAAEEETQGRMPPIRVTFEIPYFTVSGIQVSPQVFAGAAPIKGDWAALWWLIHETGIRKETPKLLILIICFA